MSHNNRLSKPPQSRNNDVYTDGHFQVTHPVLIKDQSFININSHQRNNFKFYIQGRDIWETRQIINLFSHIIIFVQSKTCKFILFGLCLYNYSFFFLSLYIK